MPNVELIIKSPSRLEQEQPLRLSVPLEGTVRDIKEALSQTHPEHPLPSDQRLIFAGRLLVDGAQTADVLRQHDVSEPQTFHLMLPIKPTTSSSSSSSGASASGAASSASARPPPTASTASSGASTSTSSYSAAAAGLHPQADARAAAASAAASAAAAAAAQQPGTASFGGGPMPAAPMMAPGQGAAFLVGGVPHQLVVQQWGGQPFVFALPYAGAYAPPGPFAPAFYPGGYGWPGMAPPGMMAPPGVGLGGQYGGAPPIGAGFGAFPQHLPTMPPFHAQMAAAAAAASAGRPAEGQAGAGVAPAGDHGAGAGEVGAGGGARGGVAAAGGGMDDLDMDGEDGHTDGLKLLLKLAFFVYILGQDGGQERLICLSIGALLIFLAQTGRLDFLQRLTIAMPRFTEPRPPPPRPVETPPPPHEGGEDVAMGDGASDRPQLEPQAVAAVEEEGRVMGFVRDVESVIGAFFASLLPSWRAHDPSGDDVPPQAPMAAGPGAM